MKATLKFDLLDPIDKKEHTMAIKGRDLFFAIQDVCEELRAMIKYGKFISEGESWALPDGYHKLNAKESELMVSLVQHIRCMLFQELENRDIDLNL